jgi:hypothetical protein
VHWSWEPLGQNANTCKRTLPQPHPPHQVRSEPSARGRSKGP